MELANSIVTLQPGMYILRHPKTGMPPISISKAAANAEHTGQIQALYTPGTDGAVLRDGKDCIVMQVLHSPVDLLVTAYLDKAGAAVPALKIDKIALGSDEVAKNTVDVPKSGMSLIGHVERFGDVLAKPGETLGKPDSEMRLEGFQVMWPDKPDGVDLFYRGTIEGGGHTPVCKLGQYCGTKGAAIRMVGVSFVLDGANVNQYELVGKAAFSGGFETDVHSGQSVTGPTGVEHLTSLTVAVRKKVESKAGSWQPSARTKVFKPSGARRGRQNK